MFANKLGNLHSTSAVGN